MSNRRNSQLQSDLSNNKERGLSVTNDICSNAKIVISITYFQDGFLLIKNYLFSSCTNK